MINMWICLLLENLFGSASHTNAHMDMQWLQRHASTFNQMDASLPVFFLFHFMNLLIGEKNA